MNHNNKTVINVCQQYRAILDILIFAILKSSKMGTLSSKAVEHFKTLRGFYQYCCGNSSTIWCSDSESDFTSSSEESSGTSSPNLNRPVSITAPNDEDFPVLDTLYTIYFDFLLITLMKSFAQKLKKNRENIECLLDMSVRIRTFLSKDGELSSVFTGRYVLNIDTASLLRPLIFLMSNLISHLRLVDV